MYSYSNAYRNRAGLAGLHSRVFLPPARAQGGPSAGGARVHRNLHRAAQERAIMIPPGRSQLLDDDGSVSHDYA